MRGSSQVLIYIDLHKALAGWFLTSAEAFDSFIHLAALLDGIEFVESANGVVLSSGVDGVIHPKYFARVIDAKTQQSLI